MSKLRLDKIPAQQETFMALLASVDGAMRLVGIWVDAKIDRKMTSLIRKHDDQQWFSPLLDFEGHIILEQTLFSKIGVTMLEAKNLWCNIHIMLCFNDNVL